MFKMYVLNLNNKHIPYELENEKELETFKELFKDHEYEIEEIKQ